MGQERSRDFIISNVCKIENPKNSSDIYAFRRIDELVGVGQKILSALEVFSEEHIDVSKLPGALEDLSTAFESYLKKVAVIKYKNDCRIV